MAVFNYDEHGSAYRGAYGQRGLVLNEARRWVSIGGALSSVALVLGLAYWGYALAVRDVTGVPVMRAASGAMRIAPADPGGEQALNQGLTVNAVAALGTSAKPADMVTLAPLSVVLQPDDLPVVPAEGAAPQSPVLANTEVFATAVEATAAEPAPLLTQDSVDAAVAAALAQGSGEPAAGDANPPLRPMPRPVELGGTAVQQADTALASAVLEKDPSAIPAGTILAQFGAYETPELARAKFDDLLQSFSEVMAGKAMVVQQAQTNGRTIYRLRVDGMANEADATSFCAALQAEGTECVPVAQR
jgi:hypothetical protein